TGSVELSGPDARSFLHNLSTQDVHQIKPGEGREAFLTTNKARVVGHGVVGCYARGGEDVLRFDTEAGRVEPVLRHLNHFLISEQVELADRSSEIGMLSVVGPGAPALIAELAGPDPVALAPWHHR